MIALPQNFVLPGKVSTLIDGFESGWSIPGISSGSCSHVATHATEGALGLKHQSVSGVESYIQKSVSLNLSAYSEFTFDIYIATPSATSFPAATIALYFLTSGSGSDYLYVTNIAVKPGMNRITLHKSQFLAAGTANLNFSQTILYIRGRLFSLASVAWEVYWDNLRGIVGRYQRPKFIFRNDDLWDTVKTWFCPALEAYDAKLPPDRKMRATLYCATSLLSTANHCVEGDIAALNDAGHDICSHSTAHVTMASYTYQQTLDDIRPNLDFVSKWNTRGRDSHLHFAYPFGGFNENVLSGLRYLGVLTGSTTLTPSVQSSDLDNNLMQVVFYADATTTLGQFTAWFDKVIATGQTGIFVSHRHVPSGATGAEINQALMTQIIAYVYKFHAIGAIDVVTEPQRYQAMTLH